MNELERRFIAARRKAIELDYQRLNPMQREGVLTTEGPLLLLAGAGSGKTTVLINRVANLLRYGRGSDTEEIPIPISEDEAAFLEQYIKDPQEEMRPVMQYLCAVQPARPWEVLAITFTNKAAGELKERLERMLGEEALDVWAATFHAACVRILRRDIDKLGYDRNFTIYDTDDSKRVIKDILKDLGLEEKQFPTRELLSVISTAKGEMLSPEEFCQLWEQRGDWRRVRMGRVYAAYNRRLRDANALDFDDIILHTVELLQSDRQTLEYYRNKFRYVLIDEYQDTNHMQYMLASLLAGGRKNICVVGDDDQSIYRFRGARPELMLGFEKDYPDAERILLDVNYRCVDPVIESAGKLIANNKTRFQKEIHGNRGKGCPVFVKEWPDPLAETKAITEELRDYHEMGIAYEDMAVLYRAHYITRGVEELLLKEKIPYTIYSGVQFFARAEIKDALSYLRMIACRDDLSFLRIANVPKRNLGERRMAFLKDFAAQNGCSLYDALRRNLDSDLLRGTKGGKFVSLIESFTGIYDQMPVSELLAAVLNESGYEAMLRTEGSQMRLDNLAELKQSIYAYETTCGEECTLEHYLAHVALFTNADLDDPRDQVRLMTVHSAKGLEFPHVFLCAMNEGIFPSKKTRTLPGMEEERRLCFVAMTRAQKALYLSEAEGRNLDGSPRYPSRFLLDIDDSLLQFTHTPREDLIRQAREYIGFSSRLLDEGSLPQSFAPGTRVCHAVFGPGTVLEPDPAQKAQLVQFDSMPTPRLLSLRARLERI